MLTLKSLALIIISPLKLAFVVFVLAILCRLRKRIKLQKLLFSFALSWLLLSSQPYVADLLLYPLEHNKSTDYRAKHITQSEAIDYVLPLACYLQTKTTIPELSRWPECSLLRMLVAKSIAEQTNAAIILTGGNFLSDKSVNYAEHAAHFLLQQGWPPEKLIVIGKGTNTREELTQIAAIVENKRITIVSSATHYFRVSKLAKELNLNAQVAKASYNSSGRLTPYIRLPSINALVQVERALYEYMAILKYYFETL